MTAVVGGANQQLPDEQVLRRVGTGLLSTSIAWDLPGGCSDQDAVVTSKGNIVILGCDGAFESTASAVSLDTGKSWIETSVTKNALTRGFWPPRRGTQMTALPDDSVLLCGGAESNLRAVGVANGFGVLRLDETATYADCWRSWDKGHHWEQEQKTDGNPELELAKIGNGALVHVGGGRVVAVGGSTNRGGVGGWRGVHAATFCLQRQPMEISLPEGSSVLNG